MYNARVIESILIHVVPELGWRGGKPAPRQRVAVRVSSASFADTTLNGPLRAMVLFTSFIGNPAR